MEYAYLAAIIVSFIGMMLLDWLHYLALFTHPKRTALAVGVGVGLFIVWDILGISLGIFFSGRSEYMSGIYLAPEFPVEELLFLTFLCYFVLVMYRLGERVWQRISY